jgi:hypothetical protein
VIYLWLGNLGATLISHRVFSCVSEAQHPRACGDIRMGQLSCQFDCLKNSYEPRTLQDLSISAESNRFVSGYRF